MEEDKCDDRLFQTIKTKIVKLYGNNSPFVDELAKLIHLVSLRTQYNCLNDASIREQIVKLRPPETHQTKNESNDSPNESSRQGKNAMETVYILNVNHTFYICAVLYVREGVWVSELIADNDDNWMKTIIQGKTVVHLTKDEFADMSRQCQVDVVTDYVKC